AVFGVSAGYIISHRSLALCTLTLCFVLFPLSEQKIITAESGQNVTLTCRAPQGKPIRAVKWSRADLGDKYVLLYRDELFDQTNQHPSFKNRVDLQDRQMKDGDVSLILKDVTINDAGTYECRVIVGESASWEIVGTVNMSVLPPGE
uniref:Ig-like domain-containing protein n=1 Tax=Pundamilia nyererei TaxID=303518 RepID=A0A3B4F0P5_9CICH